jgi:hypothetical protein
VRSAGQQRRTTQQRWGLGIVAVVVLVGLAFAVIAVIDASTSTQLVVASFVSAIAAVAAVATAWFAFDITRTQTSAALTAHYLVMRREFFEPNMLAARRATALWAMNRGTPEPPAEARTVLRFLEELGLLFHLGMLPIDFVWESFGDYVVCYYDTLRETVIDPYRARDDSFYERLIELDVALDKHKKHRAIKETRPATCTRMLDTEARLAL